MVRQLASAPGGLNRSVVHYVRIQAEDVSRQMPYQPRPLVAGYFRLGPRSLFSRDRTYSMKLARSSITAW
jgi:hypothetical protein